MGINFIKSDAQIFVELQSASIGGSLYNPPNSNDIYDSLGRKTEYKLDSISNNILTPGGNKTGYNLEIGGTFRANSPLVPEKSYITFSNKDKKDDVPWLSTEPNNVSLLLKKEEDKFPYRF